MSGESAAPSQPSDYKIYQTNPAIHQSPNHSMPSVNAPHNPVYGQLPQQYRYYNDQYQYYNQQQNYPYYMYNQQGYPYNYYQGQGQPQGQQQQQPPQPQGQPHQPQAHNAQQQQPQLQAAPPPPSQAPGPPAAAAAAPPPPPPAALLQAAPPPPQAPLLQSQAQSQDVMSSNYTVGQYQPPGIRPRVTTTMWEDEKTLCYQVDANNVSVVRRADNNMINGTKLLNVAQMTRGRRDGILKLEKVRHVVKIGLMHLKGVWIPFERALAMAQREGIVDLLYPLFVRDIKRVIQTGITPSKSTATPYYDQSQSSPATAPQVPAQPPQPAPGSAQAPHQQPLQPLAPGSIPQGAMNQQINQQMPLPNHDPNQHMYGFLQYYPSQYYPYNSYSFGNGQVYPQYQYKPKDDKEEKKEPWDHL